jgi:hypothetical protein
MNPETGVIVLLGIMVTGCAPTKNVAATSYHAVTAPVRIVHRAIAGNPSDESAVNSDVASPGRQIGVATPTPTAHPATVEQNAASGSASAQTSQANLTQTAAKPSPPPSPRAASTKPQFPVARPVPGKPGLVYSPFNSNGALIDVSGYPPGSKVKDPDTQKIFVVP